MVLPQFALAFTIPSSAPVVFDPDTKAFCTTGSGLIARLMSCIIDSFLYSVDVMVRPISNAMAQTVFVCCALAVALWGMLAMTGRTKQVLSDSLVLGVKIAFVMIFSINFGESLFPGKGGFFESMLLIMNDALRVVVLLVPGTDYYNCSVAAVPGVSLSTTPQAAYYTMFSKIDCIIESLIGGILHPATLLTGLLGFVLACFFSGPAGIFIGTGIIAIIVIILFAFIRAAYVFLVSIMGLSIMVIISPIVVPLVLFKSTYGYFEKWIKRISGFMLQPIFLFAYLSMLIMAFDVVIYSGPLSLANALYPIDQAKCQQIIDSLEDVIEEEEYRNCNLGAILYYSGAYGEKSKGYSAVNFNPRKAAGNLGLNLKDVPEGVVDKFELFVPPEHWENSQKQVYDRVMEARDFFKIDIPTNGIDWSVLAKNKDPGYPTNPDSPGYKDAVDASLLEYFTNLLLSLIMAVVTMYIFLQMLDYLPYIGSGVSGDVLGTAVSSKLAPPGAESVDKLKSRFIGGGEKK